MYLGKQRVILIVFDDFYIRWTALDRNLIIIIIIIIIRVTKFLDSLYCLDKDDVDIENKDYL